jgi:hypothetical protein
MPKRASSPASGEGEQDEAIHSPLILGRNDQIRIEAPVCLVSLQSPRLLDEPHTPALQELTLHYSFQRGPLH